MEDSNQASNGATKFTSTYTSYSGVDLLVTFGNQIVGELQQISYAVQREKVPVFTLGDANPRSFSRGKRGIAGSLVIANFDQDVMMRVVDNIWKQIAPPAMFTAGGVDIIRKQSEFTSASVGLRNGQVDPLNETDPSVLGSNGKSQIYVPAGFNVINQSNLQYADQIPPFDVTLTFANEYGQTSFQKIYDLELLNEASGVSVDSVVLEKNYTWIARSISPLYKGIYNKSTNNGFVRDNVVK